MDVSPHTNLDRAMDQVEAATFLGLAPRTLEVWRQQKRGPKFLSYSARCVRYRLRDLIAFQESTLRQGAASAE